MKYNAELLTMIENYVKWIQKMKQEFEILLRKLVRPKHLSFTNIFLELN